MGPPPTDYQLTETSVMTDEVSFGRRVTTLAREHPDKVALVFVPEQGDALEISWGRLNSESTRFARLLAEQGVGQGAMVIVGLANSPEHVIASHAAWKLGACVLPLSPKLPPHERNQLIDVARPKLVIADWDGLAVPSVRTIELSRAHAYSDEPLPDKVPMPWKAMGSGGSTGLPKIIVDPTPWARAPGWFLNALGSLFGMREGQIVLAPVPMYHNMGFMLTHLPLFDDLTVVLMERFDAARAVDIVERYRVSWAGFVPTMMQRILRLPGIKERDLSSLEAIMHTAAPCPPWVKQGWIDLLGAERVYEWYGSTEGVGTSVIRGDDWLKHPGSVGHPVSSEIRILDEKGQDMSSGEVGEIFVRPLAGSKLAGYRYLGSPPAKTTADGFVSVGDLGWVDQDGYVFIADRRVDLIISGGANVYPAEVEAVLSEHPDVGDAVVIGVPDEEWGKRVHAIVEPLLPGRPPSVDELDRFCQERLAPYKRPKTYEFFAALPRDESGKIRRSLLTADRSAETAHAPGEEG